MKALLVRVGTEIFVLPSHTVEGGMDYVGADDIMMADNREAVRLQGRIVPLVRLADLLNLERLASGTWLRDAGLSLLDPAGRGPADGADEPESDLAALVPPPLPGTGVRLQNKLPGVVVGQGDRQTCFLVDELIDELDVVVKSLGPLLTRVDTAMGATILGNGRVVIILDVPSLLLEARSRSMRGAAPPTWPVQAEVRRPRILVVDDSITTRELEKSILENAGFDVDVAMDGCEALEKLEEQRRAEDRLYDLVIADIEMPRMDGLELTQRVKTHGDAALRALPVIIVSSLASDTYKQRGIEVGAQAYITKGQFDQGHLLETINLLIH